MSSCKSYLSCIGEPSCKSVFVQKCLRSKVTLRAYLTHTNFLVYISRVRNVRFASDICFSLKTTCAKQVYLGSVFWNIFYVFFQDQSFLFIIFFKLSFFRTFKTFCYNLLKICGERKAVSSKYAKPFKNLS